jgi:3-oxocholest-4-en-26-oyl-CoA dehydrogenase alpha subunit
MRLEPTELTEDEQALRAEVRAFLTARLPAGSYLPGLGMAGDVDRQSGPAIAANGSVALRWPARAASSPLPPPLPRP